MLLINFRRHFHEPQNIACSQKGRDCYHNYKEKEKVYALNYAFTDSLLAFETEELCQRVSTGIKQWPYPL